jgi:hypothetical protein
MAKQAASGARTATPAKQPGKKRSRSVAPSTTEPTPGAIAPHSAQLPQPSHDEIALRAYALYAARGFRDGDQLHDWVTAEQQLRSAQ